MRKKILSIGIATLLLVSILCVGNLGATAEAENILAGKLPVAVETEATNANSQAKTKGLTILDNAAALTDGTAASGSLYLPGCQPLSDNNAHQCGQVKIYFDLGDTYALDTAKIVSAGTTQHKYIYNMVVYAAAIPEALFSSDSQVASLNTGYNKNTNKTNTLTLDAATVTARYVGFAFYAPAAYETSWTNFWNGRVQVEELAVYGTKVAPNILAGKLPVAVETEATNANSQAKTKGLTILDNAAALTDGTAASGSLYLPGCQPLSDNNAHQCGQVKIYFDLGDTYALDTAKIVSAGTTQHKYIYNMVVYAAAIPEALFSSDSQVASLNTGYNKNTNKTNTLTLDAATVTARYVGFAFYAPAAYETSWTNFWNGQVQVEELAVYGTKVAPNILAGKLPVAVETEATNANSQAKTKGLTILDNAAALTDGTAASGSLYLPGCYPFSDNNAHQLGQVKIYFDLEGTYTLDTMKIVSAGATQHKYIYNIAVYAAATPEALFSSDSQVASLNTGYNKNTNKTNTLTLDAATVTARYVGFAFYAPAAYETSWTNFWNGQVQVEELAVYGTACDNPLVSIGAQLRNPKATDKYALRFKFGVANQGIDYANREVSYAANISGATVTVNGESRTVVELGAIVSNDPAAANGLTLDMVTGKRTLRVVAENLYEVEGGMAQYTAVITNIPADKIGTNLYAVPYVTYQTDDSNATVYGELLTRTVAQFLE